MMKGDLPPECPMKDRCDAVFDQAVENRVAYVRELEDVARERDYWRDQATKALRALADIAEMVDYDADDGLPLHAGVPEAVRAALE